jgi:hypothetical protein
MDDNRIGKEVEQLLTYLRLIDMQLGYLLPFGEAMMERGITGTVNGLPETSVICCIPSFLRSAWRSPRGAPRSTPGVREARER